MTIKIILTILILEKSHIYIANIKWKFTFLSPNSSLRNTISNLDLNYGASDHYSCYKTNVFNQSLNVWDFCTVSSNRYLQVLTLLQPAATG